MGEGGGVSLGNGDESLCCRDRRKSHWLLNQGSSIPSLDSIPPTPEEDDIRLGYRVIVQTSTFAKGFIGNR
ncbi:MAG TPA: hypothetical protein PKZ24_07915 [Nitrospirales bacterium]|nr:hypothetical protein [Nitrospirales bacterium]